MVEILSVHFNGFKSKHNWTAAIPDSTTVERVRLCIYSFFFPKIIFKTADNKHNTNWAKLFSKLFKNICVFYYSSRNCVLNWALFELTWHFSELFARLIQILFILPNITCTICCENVLVISIFLNI